MRFSFFMGNAERTTVQTVYATAQLELLAAAGIVQGEPHLKAAITQLRQLRKKDEKTAMKQSLPAITPSLICRSRKADDPEWYAHSGIISLDLDNIPDHVFEVVRKLVNEIPYVCMSFQSPSGTGLKVFVRITPLPDITDYRTAHWQHLTAWRAVVAEMVKRVHVLEKFIDESGKDLHRLCYLGHDPDVYMELFGEKLDWTKARDKAGAVPPPPEPVAPISDTQMSHMLNYAGNKLFRTYNGQRHTEFNKLCYWLAGQNASREVLEILGKAALEIGLEPDYVKRTIQKKLDMFADQRAVSGVTTTAASPPSTNAITTFEADHSLDNMRF